MRVLITGAHGFIGKHLQRAVPVQWTVVTPKALGEVWGQDFDLCFHLAANVDIRKGMDFPAIDWDSLNTLTDVLKHSGFGRFIFVSSGAVYQGQAGLVGPHTPIHPTIPYAIAKLAGELLVEHWHGHGPVDQYLNVRLFGAYGPGEPAHKLSTKLMTSTEPVTIEGDGRNLIDPMYVEDVAELLVDLALGDQWNRTVNLATGKPLSIRQWVQKIGEVVELPPVEFGGPRPPEYHQFWSEGVEGTDPEVGLRILAESLGVPCRN